MSINDDELIDAVLAAGCEFEAAQNINDRNEVKEILQQYDTAWILLPKGFPWHVFVLNDYVEARSAISIEKIGRCKNWGEWRICGMYSTVLKREDFTLELADPYDNRHSDKIPENGIELKAALVRLLEKVCKASKELNATRIRKCVEEFEV